MATLSPKELLALWSREQLSVEMATSHMLQNLVMLQASAEALKEAVRLLQRQVDNLGSRSDPPAQKSPRKTPPSRR